MGNSTQQTLHSGNNGMPLTEATSGPTIFSCDILVDVNVLVDVKAVTKNQVTMQRQPNFGLWGQVTSGD